MGSNPAVLEKLIEKFERFPGIGRKTAQKMAFFVLSETREEAEDFANAIVLAHEKIKRCAICKNLTDEVECKICKNEARDKNTICVVEDTRDVLAFERTHEYAGVYHVLGGLISPLEGIGPDDLFIKDLLLRIKEGETKEIIMATNPTVEGEATAMYLSRLIKPLGVRVTRLAYGIPVGSDLEYADDITLYRALEGRRDI